MAEETKKEAAAAPASVNGAEVPMKIVLRKPVMAHGEEVKELIFREPTGGDIAMCGNPVIIHMMGQSEPKLLFDAQAMEAMMSRLAAVPPSTIKNMDSRDWESGAYLLSRFFMPDW